MQVEHHLNEKAHELHVRRAVCASQQLTEGLLGCRFGEEATNKCFHEMQNVIIRSLLAVQKVVSQLVILIVECVSMSHDVAC